MEKRVVEGKVRKYYTATEQGLAGWASLKKKIAELVDEVLLDK